MIKYVMLLAFLLSPSANAIHVMSKTAHVDITTDKVSRIEEVIQDTTAMKYINSVLETAGLSGDRVIIINSLGGYLDAGQAIIDSMETEKSAGVKQICIVDGEATSMAFNILTHCDVRLATRNSRFLVHKAAMGSWDENIRPTAKNLRWMANQLEREDEPFRQANAKAMHLSMPEYDEYADEERTWYAPKLYQMHYLQGIVKVK